MYNPRPSELRSSSRYKSQRWRSLAAQPFLFICAKLLVLHGLASPSLAAEAPRIQLTVDAEEVFVGESITLQVMVLNVESPDTPNVSGLNEDFRYELQGTQPMSSSSVVIINGRVTSQQEFKTVFQYQLFPKKSGTLTIPPISVIVDGKEISSEPLTVRVVQPEPQEFVFAEIQAEPTAVYPTQSFEVTLRVLVRALPDSGREPLQPLRRNPPSLTIPWIESHEGARGPEDISRWLGKLKSDRGVGFTINNYRSSDPFDFGFGRPSLAVFDLENGVIERALSDGTTAKFFRYEFRMMFQAKRSGQLTFGPASVKGTFVTEVNLRGYRGEKMAVTAEPATVTIKDVPSERPDQFMGGIGKFQAMASVSPSQARVGDPLTFTLAFSGPSTDALELVAAPDLRQIETFSQDFEIIDHAPVGRIEGKSKLFTYGIRPNKQREEIPGMTFYSFDPVAEQFVEMSTKSIPIQMREATALAHEEIVETKTENRKNLKVDRSGIFQGTAEMYPLTDDSYSVANWIGLAGLSWILSLASAWLTSFRLKPTKKSLAQRLSKSKTLSLNQLEKARESLQHGNFVLAGNCIRQSLVGLVASAADRPSEGLTSQNVVDFLSNRLESADLDRLKQVLEHIDASKYGGADHAQLQEDLDHAEALVEPIWQALRFSSKSGFAKSPQSILLIAAILFAMYKPASAEEPQANYQTIFEAALQDMNKAQSPEDFEGVARRLDALENSGIRSGSVHFHAGNAWFRAGQYGRAIRHYRLAKFFLPGDPYLQSNLEQALQMAPGKLTEASSKGLSSKILFWTYWLSHSNKIRVAAVAMALSALGIPASVWLRDRRPLFGTVALAIVATVLGIDAYLHSPQTYLEKHGVICSETVARKGMGVEYPAAFDRPLQDGAEFQVLQRTPNWTLARFSEVGDGWISNDTIAMPAR